MGSEMRAVSNAGPLIHLTKIGRLRILGNIFDEVIIPQTVKVEVVDKGKERGEPDAFLIEDTEWTRVAEDPPQAGELAERAGIHRGEACTILLARSLNIPVLLDDSDARKFALGFGVVVVGSIGLIMKAVKMGLIARDEGLKDLEKLAGVMWLSVDVYERARKIMENL